MRRYFKQGFGMDLTDNGGSAGLLKVTSTATLLTGMIGQLSSDTQEAVRVKIVEIVSNTQFRVSPVWDTKDSVKSYAFVDVSGFLLADNARIDIEPQLVEDPSQSA